MNKKVLVGIIIGVIILVIVILCIKNSNKNTANTDKINQTNERLANAITNGGNADAVKKDEKGNFIIDDNGLVELNVPISNNDIYEKDSNAGSTDKKQEAIELVKQTWGEDTTVSFRCDSVTSSGEYIVAVVSNETASVKNFFIVNLETKSVEPDV